MAREGMMSDLHALMSKHKDKKASPMEKASGLSALKNLKDEMSSMQKEGLNSPHRDDHIKKVMVAASSKEGMKEGLKRAEEVYDDDSKGSTTSGDIPLDEDAASGEDGDDMTDEEIDVIMKHLEQKKKSRTSSKEE